MERPPRRRALGRRARAQPFEDWYLVEDWAALGALNDAAVRAPREAAHDAVAAMAASPAGGLYAPQHGSLDGPAPWAGWVVKPLGEPYETFEPRLHAAVDAAGGGVVLRRQMVLGAGARVRAPRRARAGAPVAGARDRAADALGPEHLAHTPQPDAEQPGGPRAVEGAVARTAGRVRAAADRARVAAASSDDEPGEREAADRVRARDVQRPRDVGPPGESITAAARSGAATGERISSS